MNRDAIVAVLTFITFVGSNQLSSQSSLSNPIPIHTRTVGARSLAGFSGSNTDIASNDGNMAVPPVGPACCVSASL